MYIYLNNILVLISLFFLFLNNFFHYHYKIKHVLNTYKFAFYGILNSNQRPSSLRMHKIQIHLYENYKKDIAHYHYNQLHQDFCQNSLGDRLFHMLFLYSSIFYTISIYIWIYFKIYIFV
jgi:hypothetical protein